MSYRDDPEFKQRLNVLLLHLDLLESDAAENERRCTDAGQMASSALHDGARSAFYQAKKTIRRCLLDVKEEVQ